MSDLNNDLNLLIKEYGIYQCLDCGKCTGACPIAETGKDFSPRIAAGKIIDKGEDDPYVRNFIWSCLTCGRCDDLCPSGIKFSHFVRMMRNRLIARGDAGIYSHGGALFSLMRMMAAPDIKQNRMDWLPSDIKTQSQGKILYFVGCLPYFDIFFQNLNLHTTRIAVSGLKILNHYGISPVILKNERCCGHDLLWSGDEKGFTGLARSSYQEIKDHGVEEIITSCPECYYTFKEFYPGAVGNFDLKVTHIFEFLKNKLEQEGKNLKSLPLNVTFKDSCRLRVEKNVRSLPKELLGKIPDLSLREMPESQIGNICCGNSSWVNCGAHSKKIQTKWINDANKTGSRFLITSCPKCLIHLECTKNDLKDEEKIEIKDLVSLLAEAIV